MKDVCNIPMSYTSRELPPIEEIQICVSPGLPGILDGGERNKQQRHEHSTHEGVESHSRKAPERQSTAADAELQPLLRVRRHSLLDS